MKLSSGYGAWLWVALVSIGCILLAVNFSRFGWNVWGVFRGPGGRIATALYGYELLLSMIATPAVARNWKRIRPAPLRAAVGFVCGMLLAGNLFFAATIGIFMLSSAHLAAHWWGLTFLSAVLTSLLPLPVAALVHDRDGG
ncbi:hypothetical protein [Luteolibacter marinus]|uniref:hypothetical protein n=1 Tax=Luteolibacter marinus TaxID=2776705 RepID=UPI001867BA26|nr:hypothetical protein [Luteolibacter marinus]